ATGACGVPSTGPCPANFVCDPDGAACLATCNQLSDCVQAFYCDGHCDCSTQVAAGGACPSNDACSDGICGATGIGHCCNNACASADAACGATDCDGTGACSFPSTKTPCGALSCSNGTQTNASSCDGIGSCLP